ncbi:hypothetical protein H0I39_03375 [Ottowia beijingensis]|uniref:Uncharacterized protein n=1 Tax=Ottowia beijingensis TaxID=1207057 RepID=A0A853IUL4_9BURK|nr:hypothetical protein [Ottowia beijingensis]NZA01047.1 hypothetical protein [Ottowia beijingensis]
MIYIKTEKGRTALLQHDLLSVRERQVMVLCNGVRTDAELIDLFGRAISEDIDRLERRGLLAAQLSHTRPPALKAVLAESPQIADAAADAAGAHPPDSFVASRITTTQPPAPQRETLPRMSLQELAALADVPRWTPPWWRRCARPWPTASPRPRPPPTRWSRWPPWSTASTPSR